MSGELNIIWKRATVGLLICVMGTLLINKALFMHAHVQPDGSIVTHAHPFDKSGESESGASHQHTGLEFLHYHNLQILYFLIAAGILFQTFARPFFRSIRGLSQFTPSYFIPVPGRAPPAL